MIKSVLVNKRIKKMQALKDTDLLKYEMYAIFTELILSKEEFKTNSLVNEFLRKFGIEYKAYIISTRTLILSHTLKKIKNSNNDEVEMLKDTLCGMITSGEKDDVSQNNKESEYIATILKKYSRNRGK